MVVNINDNEKILKLMAHLEEIKTYYRVFYPFTSFKQLLDDKDERKAWCKEHCKDKFYSYHNIWYFKDEQDYLLFMLRWPK